jgi:deoxyribodipyrimidine photo-lyase
MSRDQRADDNWALLYAYGLAASLNLSLCVVFNLVPRFLDATIRQYSFMLRGLRETEHTLRARGVPFFLLQGEPVANIVQFVRERKASAVVADMAPLRVPKKWVQDVAAQLDAQEQHPGGRVPLFQIDAHNVVPVWLASDKQDFSARIIRPKITRQLQAFLKPFPALADVAEAPAMPLPPPVDWDAALASVEVDRTVREVSWAEPGQEAGKKNFVEFVEQRLKLYSQRRNDPTVRALSNMSPWFHFGQVSVQWCVLELQRLGQSALKADVDAFVEEAVVRRELAENFCFYNERYDSLSGAADWALNSLEQHRADPREYVYTAEQLERAETHDDIWNAAQLQMVDDGKMHGFLRMYWAKKILEWSPSPEEALRVAILLNDRYELDGRDPSGYVGCLWSIAGLHDLGWRERQIFGKIRYMNYEGCKRKFDVAAFVRRYPKADQNAKAAVKYATRNPSKGIATAKKKPKTDNEL